MDYNSLLEELFSLNQQKKVKFGLERMAALTAAFDHPDRSFPSIHVAGSNGKGSVCTKIAKAYELSGKKVGLYTSPHIASFRERIQINGEMISEEDTVFYLSRLLRTNVVLDLQATFFEITTMMALLYFDEQNVDCAVIETGLGGRLDATNILTPELSIITSISLEHTEILGKTLEEIAIEKGGIIKPGIPVVIGPRVPYEPIAAIANKNHSACHVIKGDWPLFDEENNAIVKKSLQILGFPDNLIDKSLLVLPSCRLEIHPASPPVIFDVGHNPDGLNRLFQAVRQKFPLQPLHAVCGLSSNKDIEHCLAIIARHVAYIYLVAADNHRATDPLKLSQVLEKLEFTPEPLQASILQTMQCAIDKAMHDSGIVLVCGTFFIMAEARAAIGILEPRDAYQIQECFAVPDLKKL